MSNEDSARCIKVEGDRPLGHTNDCEFGPALQPSEMAFWQNRQKAGWTDWNDQIDSAPGVVRSAKR